MSQTQFKTQVINKERYMLSVSEDGFELTKYYYPIYPYGNNVHTTIKVNGNAITYYIAHDSWGGTGSTVYLNNMKSRKLAQRLREILNNALAKLQQSAEEEQEQFNILGNVFKEMKNVLDELVKPS